MSQDDFQHGAFSWGSQMTYLSPENATSSYSDHSGFSGTYGPSPSPESHQYSSYSHDPSGLVGSTPANSSWDDVPLDPNAIYHMPLHGSAWSGTANSESPYERDRAVLAQVWEHRIRDNWLRRNGINASPTDTQYDRFIPELRAGEYAERYFARTETQPGLGGKQDILVAYPQTQSMPHSSTSPSIIDSYPSRADSAQYTPPDLGNQIPQGLNPSANLVAGDNTFTAIPSTSTSGQVPALRLLQPPYRDPPTPCSPTDASSPISLHPNAYGSQLSTSPSTVLSPLDSEATGSPLSDIHIHDARSISPAGSASAVNATAGEPSSSNATTKADSTHHSPMMTRSRSVEGSFVGQPGMGPVRRGNSAGERGKNPAGGIRVHRPAGIKWNQRTRCAYINPVTGLQCRTSAGRGPDLERHLRTVHLREEARAVSDGLIPRDKAELLPPDWVMGDRLDFDCPHCAVRFTREDARDRHVKVQHQK